MACGFGACFGCVVPLRDGGYLRVCVDGPVIDGRSGSTRASSPERAIDRLLRPRARAPGRSTARAPSTRSPRGARSATRCSSAFPFSAFVSKTITLRAARGQPAAAAVGDAGRADQLDRAAQQGPRRLPRRHDLPQLAAAAGAADHERHGLDGRGGRRARRARRARAPEIAAIELNVSCPNVKTGLDIGADPAELGALVRDRAPAAPRKPLIVKLTPNTADVALRRAGRRGGRRRRRLADQHAARLRARTRRRAGGAVARRRDRRSVRVRRSARWRSRRSAAVAARVAIPIVGMGGIASGRHARQLLEAGATLVAVGTESFRDPLAGRGSGPSSGNLPQTARF